MSCWWLKYGIGLLLYWYSAAEGKDTSRATANTVSQLWPSYHICISSPVYHACPTPPNSYQNSHAHPPLLPVPPTFTPMQRPSLSSSSGFACCTRDMPRASSSS